MKKFEVSGRDDTLLKILAHKMNFKFEYVDMMSLIEMEVYEYVTQVGSIGLEMLRRRVNKALPNAMRCFNFDDFLRKRILCLAIPLSVTNECRKSNFPSLHFPIQALFSLTPHDV